MSSFAFMFDENEDDLSESVEQKKANLVNKLEKLEKDNGRRVAYVYMGTNQQTKQNVQLIEAYAMVRSDLKKPQKLLKVHVLAEEKDYKQAYKLSMAGFLPIGVIDNCYADVLGLVHPDPALEDKDIRVMRVVNGHSYLAPKDVDMTVYNWFQEFHDLSESKETLREFLKDAITALGVADDNIRMQKITKGQKPDMN